MIRHIVNVLLLGSLLLLGLAALNAQESDPTVTPFFGPIVTPIGTVTAAPRAAAADDARAERCTAPTLPGFAPHVVRPGDRLVDLLAGSDTVTPAEAAALNCLDDPAALPVGAVIWLPQVIAPAEATPAATASTAAIDTFSADTTEPLNNEGVVFAWDATGAAAYLYVCPSPDADASCPRPEYAPTVPLRGQQAIQSFQVAGPVRYRLEAVGADGAGVSEDITLDVRCSQAALAPTTGLNRCPDDPARAVVLVQQSFEGGAMLYFSDTDEIYVMTAADGRVQIFADAYVEGLPEVEYDSVPDGRFPARRGFGIVWNQLGGPDSPLGWALAPEAGVDGARQPAGRLSYTTNIRGAGGAVYAVTFVPGATRGYWTTVTPGVE